MGRSTLERDYDIGRMLADHERRILALERRMTLLRGQAAAIGVWTNFTPSWTNVTLGTGAINTGRYVQIGQTVHVSVHFTLGTGGDVTASPFTMALPLAANLSQIPDSGTVALQGAAGARDASPSTLEKGAVLLRSVGDVRFTPMDVAGGQWGTVSPFDWTVNDQFNAWFSYETTAAVPIT